jgi:ubiquinone biosynthesis protein
MRGWSPEGFAVPQALDVSQVVPQEYAAYRPLVAEGLGFFLERLSPQRRAEILAEQLAMPHGASLPERLAALLRHCPTLHKLGQVVARDRRLALDLRRHLQSLESVTPAGASPECDVFAVIRREVGDAAGLEVGAQPLAEGSVAVVVPFTWREPGLPAPQEGVFKALKPGVEERLHEELEIWPALGTFLEERCERYGLPCLAYRDTLERVRRLLLNEIRLDLEQARLAEVARFHARSPAVLIPRLLPFTSSQVTAMERIHGGKVTDADLPPSRRRWLAETILEALLAAPFWSDAPMATFHADPHAGNLFHTRDGRLAILDWSLTARLSKAQREAMVQIPLTALMLDEARLSRALAALGEGPPHAAALRAAAGEALRQVRSGTFPGFRWLVGLFDRLATSGAMRFPEDLMFLRKALLGLDGVVADLTMGCDPDRVMIAVGLERFLRELAGRALVAPGSRAFATHVSNADLFGLCAAWPATAARFWIGAWQDALGNQAIGRSGDLAIGTR